MIDSHTDEEKSKKLSGATRGFGFENSRHAFESARLYQEELLRSLFLGWVFVLLCEVLVDVGTVSRTCYFLALLV